MILIWVAQGRGEFTGVVCERMRGGLGVELEGNAARALYVEDEPENLVGEGWFGISDERILDKLPERGVFREDYEEPSPESPRLW